MRRILVVIAAALGFWEARVRRRRRRVTQLWGWRRGLAGAQAAGAQSAPRRVNRQTRTSPFASSALVSTATSGGRTPSAPTRRRETRTSPAVGEPDAEQLVQLRGRHQAVGQQADSSQAATALSSRSHPVERREHPTPGSEPGRLSRAVSRSRTASSPARRLRTRTARASPPSRLRRVAPARGRSDRRQAVEGGAPAGSSAVERKSRGGDPNISVRVLLSPGNGGSVTQSNAVASKATAANIN